MMKHISYNHPASRLGRSAQRIMRYYKVLDRNKTIKIVKTFWWDRHPNFGDLLTELILPYYNIAPVIVAPEKAQLFAIGSVIEMSPEDFSGFFWTSGKMHGDRVTPRPQAKFLAVRGTKTQTALDLPDSLPRGDGGLLISKVAPARLSTGKVGFIPHFTHHEANFTAELTHLLGEEGLFIDVTQSPQKVAEQISSCTAVFSTSLHGVILADAYGVPACWALPEPVLNGGDHKFYDYESVFPLTQPRRVMIEEIRGAEDILSHAKTVSQERLHEIQEQLENSLDELHKSLSETTFTGIIKAQFAGPLHKIKNKIFP